MDEPHNPEITGRALLDFLDRPTPREVRTVHNCRTYVRKILGAAYGDKWATRPFTKADVPRQLDRFAATATIGVDSIRSYQSGYSSLVEDYLAWAMNRPTGPTGRRYEKLFAEVRAHYAELRAKSDTFVATLHDDINGVNEIHLVLVESDEEKALVAAVLNVLSDEMLDHIREALA